jgi:hypothetical protein
MNKRWLCVLGMLVISVSLAFAEKVSLQDVNVFPELYVGSSIEIEGVNLDGKMKKDMGFYCMGVGVRGDARDKTPAASSTWSVLRSSPMPTSPKSC